LDLGKKYKFKKVVPTVTHLSPSYAYQKPLWRTMPTKMFDFLLLRGTNQSFVKPICWNGATAFDFSSCELTDWFNKSRIFPIFITFKTTTKIKPLKMTNCKNCNVPTDRKYYSNCGQAIHLKRIDGHYILHEIEHIFHFERGILYIIKELLIHPGQTVREFITDNRNRLLLFSTGILIDLIIKQLK
jgi:hypothetical protein